MQPGAAQNGTGAQHTNSIFPQPQDVDPLAPYKKNYTMRTGPTAIVEEPIPEDVKQADLVECSLDASESAAILGIAGTGIDAAVHDCASPTTDNDRAQCAATVSGIITIFLAVGSFLSGATWKCAEGMGLPENIHAACAEDITAMLVSFGDVATVGASLTQTCGKVAEEEHDSSSGSSRRLSLRGANNANTVVGDAARFDQTRLPAPARDVEGLVLPNANDVDVDRLAAGVSVEELGGLSGGRSSQEALAQAAVHGGAAVFSKVRPDNSSHGTLGARGRRAQTAIPIFPPPQPDPADTADCVLDNVLATGELMRAGVYVKWAVESCAEESQVGCTSDVSAIVTSFSAVAALLSLAVSTCPAAASTKAECSTDVTSLIAAVTNLVSATSSLTETCEDALMPNCPDCPYLPG